MKRFLVATIVLLCTSSIGFAQQDSPDTPATMEDVQKYLEIMHSREMMSKMIVAMVQPMHQMMHEQYEKDKDKLPASTAESAAVIMPIIQKKMEAMSHDVQQQVAEMIKESETKPGQNPPTSKN